MLLTCIFHGCCLLLGAGTSGDYETAQYMLQHFQAYGLEAEIQPVKVSVTYPLTAFAAVISPPSLRFRANLSENIEAVDPTSDTWYRNHTFNAYAPSGNATGLLVYANYGTTCSFPRCHFRTFRWH